MNNAIFGLATYIAVAVNPVPSTGINTVETPVIRTLVSEKTLDLTNRTNSPTINEGFADNILLSLHYLKGESFISKIDWEKIRAPFEVNFTLWPGEVFAFDPNVLPEYKNFAVTMNTYFMTDEGYKVVAGLGGNGVCHLATVINWAASDAGLEVKAPVNHNFFPVRGTPRENGTAINSNVSLENLYIKNNFELPVTFVINADPKLIKVRVAK